VALDEVEEDKGLKVAESSGEEDIGEDIEEDMTDNNQASPVCRARKDRNKKKSHHNTGQQPRLLQDSSIHLQDNNKEVHNDEQEEHSEREDIHRGPRDNQ
jgi:hypothetical protein